MLPRSYLIAWFITCFLMGVGHAQTPQISTAVHTLTLSNVHAVSPAQQERIVRDVLRQVDTRISDNEKYSDEIASRIRFEFQKLGYFKVMVKELVVQVLDKDDHREIVDVDVAVDEGEQYTLKNVQFTEETVFSTAELRSAFPIADGDLFNREKIAAGLENLRQLYGRKGYVNFSAVPETNVDESSRSISLSLDLDKGAIFRVGTLTVRGEESEPGAREKLLSTWQSYQGRIFDPTLLRQFLLDIKARPNVKPEQIFELSQDTDAQVMNVSIALTKPPLF